MRSSWEARAGTQAECMHVLWGPWKERARLGMGITGMSGPDEPLAEPAHDSVEAAWVDDMALLRDVARGLKFGV